MEKNKKIRKKMRNVEENVGGLSNKFGTQSILTKYAIPIFQFFDKT